MEYRTQYDYSVRVHGLSDKVQLFFEGKGMNIRHSASLLYFG